MIPFYKDYYWKEGKPIGLHKTSPEVDEKVYRIVSDPYYKWITLEAYSENGFSHLVYDSRFLDFRKLTPEAQAAWRKEAINENESWLFNEEDRLILKEVCRYHEEICREIKLYSPYHTLICHYDMEEGPLGFIQLFDSNEHPVMSRNAINHQSR